MSDTLEEKLERVQKAIAAIEGGGQSVSYEGRAVTKGDLKTLYDREIYLEKRLREKHAVEFVCAEVSLYEPEKNFTPRANHA